MKLDKECAMLTDVLRARSELMRDQIALRFLGDGSTESETITYSGLNSYALKIAMEIRKSHRSCGERVMLLLPPGLDYIGAFFGCLYAGMVAVPAYPPSKRSHLQYRIRSIAEDCRPISAITLKGSEEGVREVVDSVCGADGSPIRVIRVDDLDDVNPADWQAPSIDAGDLAFLQYTSGSTGDPKGVMVSHANLMHNSEAIYDALKIHEKSCVVSWLPAFHDMGLIATMLQPIYGGFEGVLMPPASFLKQPVKWLKAITDYRGTISFAPNFAYEHCIERVTDEEIQALDLSSWEAAVNGAEPVKAKTMDRFTRRFSRCGFQAKTFAPAYGMAEATLLVTTLAKEKFYTAIQADKAALQSNRIEERHIATPSTTTVVGCGESMVDQRLLIVNAEHKTVCGDGEIGEIWISGPSVAAGYWGKADATEATFRASLETEQGCFLRTGDLGFMADGNLYVTGRLKDLIITRGSNHYPQDIEATAGASHAALNPACCAAFTVEEGEERLVIVQEIQRSHLRKIDLEEIAAAITQAVADEHELRVDAIALIKPGNLPRTSSGKVQRQFCKQQYLNNGLELIAEWSHPSTPPAPPETVSPFHEGFPHSESLVSWLAIKVAALLNVAPREVDTSQPISRLGLDSVTALLLVGEIESRFQRKLPPTLLFDYPTIEALARYLTNATGATRHMADLSAIEGLSDSEAERLLSAYAKR